MTLQGRSGSSACAKAMSRCAKAMSRISAIQAKMRYWCFFQSFDSELGVYQTLGFKPMFQNNVYSRETWVLVLGYKDDASQTWPSGWKTHCVFTGCVWIDCGKNNVSAYWRWFQYGCLSGYNKQPNGLFPQVTKRYVFIGFSLSSKIFGMGMEQVIPSLVTKTGELWVSLASFKAIL